MATAELAVTLPLLTIMVLLGCGVVGAVRDDLRCHDAARIAARAAARGESIDAIRAVAEAAAPVGARVVVVRDGGQALVSISLDVGVPGPWSGEGPRWTVGARAVARSEGAVP